MTDDQGNLRVHAAIDDGSGWSAFIPLCDDFIKAPDGGSSGSSRYLTAASEHRTWALIVCSGQRHLSTPSRRYGSFDSGASSTNHFGGEVLCESSSGTLGRSGPNLGSLNPSITAPP